MNGKCIGFIVFVIIIIALISCDGASDNHTFHQHQWSEWTEIIPATLTSTGKRERICIDCLVEEKRDTALVGGIGTGGGTVFYYNPAGFNVTGVGLFTAYFLEAAPANTETTLAWASLDFISISISGTGTAIGTGRANTARILEIDSNAPAAKACYEYSYNEKNDWFLPSRNELNAMYNARTYLDISQGRFWSSSQYSSIIAWGLIFDSYGSYTYLNKDNFSFNVRAIRAF